jgi:ABC-2 type transport system permease protein
MRLRGLIRKEFLQVVRDPSSIGIAFVLPVILLFLFGYGISLDTEHVPVAIVAEKPSEPAERLVARFAGSPYFASVMVPTLREAEQQLSRHAVDGIVHIRGDFVDRLFSSDRAQVQLLLNGVDANTARLVEGYAQGVWGRWLEEEARARGQPLRQPVVLEQRIWFNAEVRSRNFLVPGIVAIVMTLIGALLTALVMAREWERGTMEALLVTPVRMGEILLGKLLPYFMLGMAGMAISVAMGVWLLGVPFRGSLWVLTATSALFLLTALGLGLLISSLARSQFVAAQAAIVATFLPTFMLSGFLFDIGNMPVWLQCLTRLVPARYYVAILQTEFLTGDVWSIVLPNATALAVMATLLLAITWLRARKRLE